MVANLGWIFMVSKWWIRCSFMISWLFFWHLHDVYICGFKLNVLLIVWTGMPFCMFPQRINPTDFGDFQTFMFPRCNIPWLFLLQHCDVEVCSSISWLPWSFAWSSEDESQCPWWSQELFSNGPSVKVDVFNYPLKYFNIFCTNWDFMVPRWWILMPWLFLCNANVMTFMFPSGHIVTIPVITWLFI